MLVPSIQDIDRESWGLFFTLCSLFKCLLRYNSTKGKRIAYEINIKESPNLAKNI